MSQTYTPATGPNAGLTFTIPAYADALDLVAIFKAFIDTAPHPDPYPVGGASGGYVLTLVPDGVTPRGVKPGWKYLIPPIASGNDNMVLTVQPSPAPGNPGTPVWAAPPAGIPTPVPSEWVPLSIAGFQGAAALSTDPLMLLFKNGDFAEGNGSMCFRNADAAAEARIAAIAGKHIQVREHGNVIWDVTLSQPIKKTVNGAVFVGVRAVGDVQIASNGDMFGKPVDTWFEASTQTILNTGGKATWGPLPAFAPATAPVTVTELKPSVADAAALAALTGNAYGDLRVTLNDGHMHVWVKSDPTSTVVADQADHWSNIGPAAAGLTLATTRPLDPAFASTTGTATTAAHADHQHKKELPTPVAADAGKAVVVNAAGDGVELVSLPSLATTAPSDPAAAPVVGTATTAAHADHQHKKELPAVAKATLTKVITSTVPDPGGMFTTIASDDPTSSGTPSSNWSFIIDGGALTPAQQTSLTGAAIVEVRDPSGTTVARFKGSDIITADLPMLLSVPKSAVPGFNAALSTPGSYSIGPVANDGTPDGSVIALVSGMPVWKAATDLTELKSPVASFAALPPSANSYGDIRVTLDDGFMHVWVKGVGGATAPLDIDHWDKIGPAAAGGATTTKTVVGQAPGVAAVGTSPDAAHADHVHPKELPAIAAPAGTPAKSPDSGKALSVKDDGTVEWAAVAAAAAASTGGGGSDIFGNMMTADMRWADIIGDPLGKWYIVDGKAPDGANVPAPAGGYGPAAYDPTKAYKAGSFVGWNMNGATPDTSGWMLYFAVKDIPIGLTPVVNGDGKWQPIPLVLSQLLPFGITGRPPAPGVSLATAAPANPAVAAAVGTGTSAARGDHVHRKELPAVTAADNDRVLRVAAGAWASGPRISIHTSAPTAADGSDGDIWIVYKP